MFEHFASREEFGYRNFENAELVKTVLDKLSEPERKVFQLRFFDSRTQQEIADAMGVSQMTISRLEKRLKDKFREEYYR